jgi:hypothetical protein
MRPGGRSTTKSSRCGRSTAALRSAFCPSAAQASGFAGDLELREAMDRAGVQGMPRIEIFTDA